MAVTEIWILCCRVNFYLLGWCDCAKAILKVYLNT